MNSNTPLLNKSRNNPKHLRIVARYRHADGGSVTLSLPSPAERPEPISHRGRARTVSSVAPLPESCYTINSFLFFLCCFQVMNLLTLTYTDSVINYIAKRFNIPNTMASFIPSSYQIGNMVVIIPVSYYGNRFNRPKAIAAGVLVMVIGLAFCVLPHFVLPTPKIFNATDTELCDHTLPSKSSVDIQRSTMLALPDNLPCNANGTVYNPAVLLIIGHTLIGAGAAPLWPLGVAYVDDHVILQKVPMYLAVFIGVTLMGPVFGFLLGSVSSAIYVTLQTHHINQSNPGYIGAWWLGYLIACIILTVLLFPFYFYPRSLPVSLQKQAEVAEMQALRERQQMSRTQSQLEQDAAAEVEASASEASSVAGCSVGPHLDQCEDSGWAVILSKIADFFCAIKRTLSTPLVLTGIISYIAMANLLSGVATFGSSYVQRIFNVFRTTSDMLIGGVCVPMGILGTLTGGYIMKKRNFDIRQSLIFLIIMSSIGCMLMASVFGVGCQMQRIAGLTHPYSGSTSDNITGVCNYACNCPRGQFELICGTDEISYLSPCFAGCTTELKGKKHSVFKNKQLYRNCSCIASGNGSAISGPCSTKHCGVMLGIFMVLAGIGVFFLCLCQAPIYVVLLRMLVTEDKSLGIGLMAFLSRLLGYIPGPIWFGMILDRSCIYWSAKCLGKSVCLLYDTLGLRYSYVGLCFACSFAYMTVFAISFIWMECNKDRYEKYSVVFFPDTTSESESASTSQETDINSPWK